MASVNVCVFVAHYIFFLPNSSPYHLVGLEYIVSKQLIRMSNAIVTGKRCLIGIGI